MLQAQIKMMGTKALLCAHPEVIWRNEELAQFIPNFGIRWR